jgi:hypothetical protein
MFLRRLKFYEFWFDEGSELVFEAINFGIEAIALVLQVVDFLLDSRNFAGDGACELAFAT